MNPFFSLFEQYFPKESRFADNDIFLLYNDPLQLIFVHVEMDNEDVGKPVADYFGLSGNTPKVTIPFSFLCGWVWRFLTYYII